MIPSPSWLLIELFSNKMASVRYVRLMSLENAPQSFAGVLKVYQKLDRPGERWTDLSRFWIDDQEFLDSSCEIASPLLANQLLSELFDDLGTGTNLQLLLLQNQTML